MRAVPLVKALCIIAAAALCTAPSLAQAPAPALVGYWHNWNSAAAPAVALDRVDARYNVVAVAFAVPIGGTQFRMGFTPDGTTPLNFASQLRSLQQVGRTVLISIGGANDPVLLRTSAERDTFVATMTAIIDTYGFDGIDIDFEGGSLMISGGSIAQPFDAAIVNLIEAVRNLMTDFRAKRGRKMILTLAPETACAQGGMSAFAGVWGSYLPLIHALRDSIDIVHAQLYNSGTMYGIDGGIYAQGTADFLVASTEAMIRGFTTGGGFFAGLAPSQIAVGVPASPDAAGGGFSDTSIVKSALDYLRGRGPKPGTYTLTRTGGYPDLRGMMTWSINWDATAKNRVPGEFARNYQRIFGGVTRAEELPTTAALRIHPNPAASLVAIEAQQTLDLITIRDALGREVQRHTPAAPSCTIDVTLLSPGVYFVIGENLLGKFLKR